MMMLGIFLCHSQEENFRIDGVVYDLDERPLSNVNIYVKKSGETLIIAYTKTDVEGKFTISFEDEVVDIYFNLLGFEETVITYNSFEQGGKPLIVQLPKKEQSLEEVFLNVEKDITIKKDTITIRTKSFEDGTEEAVEDLLKKLPGIEVDEKGNIKVNGRTIEKVMVEGDDFFGRGYKLLTKNLDAAAIKEVEIYKRYSSNRLLKGIEQSNKVALNLKLKEDKKFNWFGNASLGYGVASENRYQAKVNLSSFSKKAKYFLLSNLNNLGLDTTGDIDDLVSSRNTDNFSSLGNEVSVTPAFRKSNGRALLKETRQNLNNFELVSLNSIFHVAPAVKTKLIMYYDSDDRLFETFATNTFTLNQERFTNTEENRNIKSEDNLYVNMELDYDINKTTTLEYQGKYRQGFNEERGTVQFNNTPFDDRLSSQQKAHNHNLILTKKLTDTKVLHLTTNYQFIDFPSDYITDRLIITDENENFLNAQNEEEQSQRFYGGELNFLSKYDNKDLLEIKAGFSSSLERLTPNFFTLNEDLTREQPFGIQEAVSFKRDAIYVEPRYNLIGKRLSATASVRLAYREDSRAFMETENTFQKLVVLPALGVNWEINSKNKITAQYDFNARSNTIEEIYPDSLLKNFRTSQQGLDSPILLNTRSLLINYSLGNWTDRFFLNGFLNYNIHKDYLSTQTFASTNVTAIETIALQDRELVNLAITADQYLKKLSLNLKLRTGYEQENFSSIVNLENRDVISETLNAGVELKSVFNGVFNFHLGTRAIINEAMAQNISNRSLNYFSFLDTNFRYKNFNLGVQTERLSIGNQQQQLRSFNFIDLSLSYQDPKNKLNISIRGNNLLNTETFTDLFVSDLTISSTQYRLIDRYVLMQVNFRF